jgi:hypothetical protein
VDYFGDLHARSSARGRFLGVAPKSPGLRSHSAGDYKSWPGGLYTAGKAAATMDMYIGEAGGKTFLVENSGPKSRQEIHKLGRTLVSRILTRVAPGQGATSHRRDGNCQD